MRARLYSEYLNRLWRTLSDTDVLCTSASVQLLHASKENWMSRGLLSTGSAWEKQQEKERRLEAGSYAIHLNSCKDRK